MISQIDMSIVGVKTRAVLTPTYLSRTGKVFLIMAFMHNEQLGESMTMVRILPVTRVQRDSERSLRALQILPIRALEITEGYIELQLGVGGSKFYTFVPRKLVHRIEAEKIYKLIKEKTGEIVEENIGEMKLTIEVPKFDSKTVLDGISFLRRTIPTIDITAAPTLLIEKNEDKPVGFISSLVPISYFRLRGYLREEYLYGGVFIREFRMPVVAFAFAEEEIVEMLEKINTSALLRMRDDIHMWLTMIESTSRGETELEETSL